MGLFRSSHFSQFALVLGTIFFMSFLTACGGSSGGGSDESPGINVTPNSLILSEDGSANFEVTLNSEPGSDVTLSVISTDLSEATASPASLTFNAVGGAPWNSPQTITVTGVHDSNSDGNQTISITLDPSASADSDYAALAAVAVSATVSDIDIPGFTFSTTTLNTSEGGLDQSFTMVLNKQPDGDVVIDVSSTDSSEGTVTPTILTFTATDWNIAQTVTVSPVDDIVADGNQTYPVTLAINTGSTADTTGYTALSQASVVVTNTDNDTAGVTYTPSSLTTSEGGAAQTFTVVLNTMPDGDVVIDVASADTTEGIASPASLTFTMADWDIDHTVTVSPVDDPLIDGNQIYNVNLSVNANSTDNTGYTILDLPPVAVTNADTDTAGITVTPLSLSTVEMGTSTSYTLVLNTQPAGNVVIDVSSIDTTEGTVTPASLNFDSVNWQTPQTVTVTPVDDPDTDGSVIYDINHSINADSTTDNTGYAVVAIDSVAVINGDDETTEGTTVTPVDITLWTPYSSYVDANQYSFYVINDLVPGNSYTVSLTGLSASSGLRIYQDQFVNTACAFGGTVNVECTFTALDTSVWVRVGSTSAFYFTVNIIDNGVGKVYVPEGTVTPVPLVLDAVYVRGSVDLTASHYTITGLTPGANYGVKIAFMTDDLDLFVYSDAGETTLLCDAAEFFEDEECYFTASGDQVWIKVDGAKALLELGADYSIRAATGLPAEGSIGGEVVLTLGSAHSGSVDTNNSYYTVTGLSAGDYSLNVTNVSDEVFFYVYSDSAYTNLLCQGSKTVLGPGYPCNASLASAGDLFILISGGPSLAGAAYTLDVL